MADAKQALIDAISDAESWSDFINGQEGESVVTRLNKSYPTLREALSQLYLTGGLPATPYDTLSELEASGVTDGFAMVTNNAENNGLYEYKNSKWQRSEFDSLSRSKTYIDSQFKYGAVLDLSPLADLSAFDDIVESRGKKLYGVFVERASASVKAHGSNPQALALPVKSGAYYAFNRRTDESPRLYVMGHTNEITYGTSGLRYLPYEKIENGNYIVRIPDDINWIAFSAVLPNSGYTIYDTYDGSPVLKVVEYLGDAVAINGANIADTALRAIVGDSLTSGDIKTVAGAEALGGTAINGYYVGWNGITAYQTADMIEFKVEPNTLYTVYYGGNFAENENIKVARVHALADKFDPSNPTAQESERLPQQGTDDPYVMTFLTPSDKTWVYLSLRLESGAWSYDARGTLMLARGSKDPRPTIREINNLPLMDYQARQQVQSLIDSGGVVSPLRGKKIAIIGDSITADSFRAEKGWGVQLSERVGGMELYNYGISSTGFFDRQDVVSTMADEPFDYIVVNLGSNDAQTDDRALPLGVWKDNDPNTLNGAMFKIFTELKAKYPLSKIAVFTPIPRVNHIGEDGTSKNGYSMRDIADLLIRYANHFSFPHLDMLRNSGLDPSNPVQNDTYFKAPNADSGDGVHPNDAGFARMVDRFKPFLESI